MRVLVVEDEEGIRDLLVRGLAEDGHEVEGVGSAEEAMDKVTAFLHDELAAKDWLYAIPRKALAGVVAL